MDIITVFFIYGLSFFSMGLAVLLEAGRSSKFDFARALRPLAGFGLVHGCHEWFEMFLLINKNWEQEPLYAVVGPGRVVLLAISFFFLIDFGARLITGPSDLTRWKLFGTIAAIWAVGLVWVLTTQPAEIEITAADVYTRYSLAIPGAALTAWGLALQQRRFLEAGMKNFGTDVIVAAVAFGLYGGIGQLFATPSPIFPSPYVNSVAFQAWFGFPVQLFRSAMAFVAAVAMIRSLRAFEEEKRQQIDGLRAAQQAEQQRLEGLRAELLRRTVRAQESERQRIARELHDELGQTLTAIGLGLRALGDNITSKPAPVLKKQAHELENLVGKSFDELQNLITGLHPPQLDDFGLMPALRWCCTQYEERYGLKVELTSSGEEKNLPADVRVVLYRITQEAITNIIRHAGTDHAKVHVGYNDREVSVQISDTGCGFNVDHTLKASDHPAWGLLGMKERAALVGGECRITSQAEAGTQVEVIVPIAQGKTYVDDTIAAG